MVTLDTATGSFQVTQKQLDKVPILHSIPDWYGLRPEVVRGKVHQLVSVKQAKQLADEVFKTIDIFRRSAQPYQETLAPAQFLMYNHITEASLEAPGRDFSGRPEYYDCMEDPFEGMGSISMPYLSQKEPESGFHCRGCILMEGLYYRKQLPVTVAVELLVPEISPINIIAGMTDGLHSKEGLKKHVKHCYGRKGSFNCARESRERTL